MLAHEIDATLVTVEPRSESLQSIELFRDEIFCAMHEENELSKKEFLSPEDFLNVNLIIHSFPMETVSVHKHFLKPHGINPINITEIPMTEIALEMINANMGVLAIPKWALKSFKAIDQVVYKRIGHGGLKRTHYLVVRKEDRMKRYMDDFVNSVLEDYALK